MSKKTKSVDEVIGRTIPDVVSFSIVALPVDQNSTVASQRVLQIVTKNGVTKTYVTESSYFKGEVYQNLSKFIELSYEASIRRDQMALKPVTGGRYWVHFGEATLNGDKQKRVNPELFE